MIRRSKNDTSMWKKKEILLLLKSSRQTKNVKKHTEAGERIKKENMTLERQRKTTRKGIISSTQRKSRILKRRGRKEKRKAKKWVKIS